MRLIEFIRQRAKSSWETSIAVHKRGLAKGEGILRLLISLLLLLIIFMHIFPIDWVLSISFLFSGSMSIYSGLIYRKEPYIIIFVFLGVVVGSLLTSTILPTIIESSSKGEWIGAAFQAVIGLVIFSWSSSLKQGVTPSGWQDKRNKRKKQNSLNRKIKK